MYAIVGLIGDKAIAATLYRLQLCNMAISLEKYTDLTDLSSFEAGETEIGMDWIAVTGRRALVTKEKGLQKPIGSYSGSGHVTVFNNRVV